MNLTPAVHLADMLLPLGGPDDPDAVLEAGRTIAELVRRLNHATFHPDALRYPSQLDRVVGSINAALYGLEQTLGQLATRLDTWAADPALGHDTAHDAATPTRAAAVHLRNAAAHLGGVTAPIAAGRAITHQLSYHD